MSALDDPPTTTDTSSTPCDTDKEPLLWSDGNYARIPGLLFEFSKWTVREALLQPWYQHRAVLVGRMTYVEDISSIPFMMGTIEDPIERTAQNPCPIGKTRVKEYDDHQDTLVDAKSGAPVGVHYSPPSASDITASGITVSKLQTAKEDGEDFKLLWKVFGNAECSDEIAEIAQGSGTKLRAELAKRHREATTADQAVIDTEFTRVLSTGVGSELTASSLKAYIKAYKRARMGVLNPPAAGAEVQMISTIAFSDTSVNSLYEVKATVKPPKTLDAAVGILSGILTARVRSEELAQARDAAPRPALAATKPSTKPPPDAPPSPPATPSLMEMLIAQQQQLTALIAKQGVPDPRKTKAEKEKEKKAAKAAKAAAEAAKKGKVVPPRDENNRVTHWIEGMDPCKECGGKHLHRDHAKHAGSASGTGLLTVEEMQHQLNVLLAQQEQVANAAANGTSLIAQAIEPSESGESDES